MKQQLFVFLSFFIFHLVHSQNIKVGVSENDVGQAISDILKFEDENGLWLYNGLKYESWYGSVVTVVPVKHNINELKAEGFMKTRPYFHELFSGVKDDGFPASSSVGFHKCQKYYKDLFLTKVNETNEALLRGNPTFETFFPNLDSVVESKFFPYEKIIVQDQTAKEVAHTIYDIMNLYQYRCFETSNDKVKLTVTFAIYAAIPTFLICYMVVVYIRGAWLKHRQGHKPVQTYPC